jgi:hypothetical protein
LSGRLQELGTKIPKLGLLVWEKFLGGTLMETGITLVKKRGHAENPPELWCGRTIPLQSFRWRVGVCVMGVIK